MENKKWLLGLISAASLIGAAETSLKILDGAGLAKASQPPTTTATDSKSDSSEENLGIEHYQLKH